MYQKISCIIFVKLLSAFAIQTGQFRCGDGLFWLGGRHLSSGSVDLLPIHGMDRWKG